MKNNIIRGVRKASDFLMALQLTGRVQGGRRSPTSRRELPAVVIGGGLTAIDTATELLAYYPIQAEKTLDALRGRWSRSAARKAVRAPFDEEEREMLDACSRTAREVRGERERARRGRREPDFARLCRAWGGVSIVYRRAHGGFARLPPEPRRGHQGARGGDSLHRGPRAGRGRARRASASCAAVRFRRVAAAARWSTLPARDRAAWRRGRPRTSPTRRSSRGTFRSTSGGDSSRRTARCAGRRCWRLDPAPAHGRDQRFFTGYSRGREVRHVLRRQPPRATPATSSRRWPRAKDGYRAIAGALPGRRLPGRGRRRAPMSWDEPSARRLDDALDARASWRSTG